MRILTYTLLLAIGQLPMFCNAQIGAKTKPSIQGIWQNSDFGYQMTLMLNADGSGEFDGEMIQYKITGNNLQLNAAGVTTMYTYQLQENQLKLSGGDLDAPISFTRNGSGNTVPTSQPTATHSTNDVGNLVGIWSGNGESIEFKSNGQCLYLGSTLNYQATANQLTLISSQGNFVFSYTIANNQLTLSANGNQVVYAKGAQSAPPAASGNGTVAMELVGKWCWINVTSSNSGGSSSSRCITLNADGTYFYASEGSRSVNTNTYYGGTSSQSSDQGTWYVQGDRIYYNSQTNGQGSYRLEKRNHPKNVNDPMIVLDGEAYVTATLKQPWR